MKRWLLVLVSPMRWMREGPAVKGEFAVVVSLFWSQKAKDEAALQAAIWQLPRRIAWLRLGR